MRQNMDAFLTSPGPQYRINGGVCWHGPKRYLT
jgi:hypothetical protein